MNTATHNGSRQQANAANRKFSFFASEAVWQFALVTVVFIALIDGALSLGGGTIA